MTINPDGSFNLEKGEKMPYICPKDGWPIPYEENIIMVHCMHCGHVGSKEEFSKDILLKEE